MRKFGVMLVALVVAGLTMAGVGAAAAEPQLPRVVQYSENIGTFGDHDFCHGTFNVGMVAPKGKRGVIRLTLTSFGFTGNGAGWKRNPRCRVLMDINYASPSVGAREIFVPATFGPRRGDKVVRDIYTGSGPAVLSVWPYAAHNPLRVSQGYGSTFYTVVP
ncbi:enoyl-CoA hydratase [Gordonia sp. CPCC 206044]|uniref:enoyl-CoA hydratase n=1 Tax=Gordonia sp. CPCC 206044 TaxID=3140793 RepID=UPI003AF3F5FA